MTLEEHALQVWRLDCLGHEDAFAREIAPLEHEIEQASTSDLLLVFFELRHRSGRVRDALAKEIDARIPRRRA